jgi:ketosteroid isomerase-like protein
MLDRVWAEQFAAAWVAAWNAGDLPRILSHYAEDFEMSSPFIIERMSEPSGTLRGKEAISVYWQRGLDAAPPLRFELLEVLVGVESIVLHYRSSRGVLAAETLTFNDAGQVRKGAAHYRKL